MNVKPLYLVVAVLCLILVSGCAKRIDQQALALQNQPGWITGESLRYPEHLYLLGRGSDSNSESSTANAWKDLNNQYIAALKKNGSSSTGVDDASYFNVTNEKFKNQVGRVAEAWRNPVEKRIYTLVMIDRVKAGKLVEDEIYKLDNQIKRSLQRAEKEQDSLQQIAYARLASEKFRKRRSYATALNVIKPTAILRKPEWNLARISNFIDDYIASTSIKPITDSQQDNSTLLNALTSGIKNAGFNVELNGRPDYFLKASIENKAITWKDGVFTMHGKVKLELIDGEQQNQIRGSTSWPIEVSAPEREELPEKLADAVVQINSDKLKQAFIDFQLN